MANWLLFAKIEQWGDVGLSGFQYDYVTDADIARALSDTANLGAIDTARDWEDDMWLAEQACVPDDQKHAYRVAALVAELRAGGWLREAIELDTFSAMQCCSCVPNGHHRIRALQYLGVCAGPFSLNGHLNSLEDLVRLAGTDCPNGAQQFVAPQLVCSEEFDVTG